MKHLMTVLALSVACFSTMTSTSAFATSHKEAPEMGKQQSKMGECNKDAGDKKGDERKAFMKTCLSAKKASQQEKMKACNADPKAKAAKGDERKAFMKECLSK
jgi:psiF repeat